MRFYPLTSFTQYKDDELPFHDFARAVSAGRGPSGPWPVRAPLLSGLNLSPRERQRRPSFLAPLLILLLEGLAIRLLSALRTTIVLVANHHRRPAVGGSAHLISITDLQRHLIALLDVLLSRRPRLRLPFAHQLTTIVALPKRSSPVLGNGRPRSRGVGAASSSSAGRRTSDGQHGLG